jgi:hypothetical protein
MIARGERPQYRLRAQDGRWTIDALSWLTVTGTSYVEALDAAREAIEAWLDVPADTFDVIRASVSAPWLCHIPAARIANRSG